jgi:hypothetical protein
MYGVAAETRIDNPILVAEIPQRSSHKATTQDTTATLRFTSLAQFY